MTEQEQAMAAVMRALENDPRTRKQLMGMVRQIAPDVPLPELELESLVDKRAESLEKQIEEMKNERARERAQAELDRLRNAPVSKGLIAADQMGDLDKFAKDNGFDETQYEQAARLMRAEQAVMRGTSESSDEGRTPSWEPGKLDDFVSNPIRTAQERAMDLSRQLRLGNIRIN